MLRAVLAAQKRVLGAEHADSLATQLALAILLGHQAKYAEAAEILRAVLPVQARIFGKKHPDTLKTAKHLSKCLSYKKTQHAREEKACKEADERPRKSARAGPGSRVCVHRLLVQKEWQ